MLVEWEKNQIKPLFKEFDSDKKGITFDQLKKVFERLGKDECIIGKIPDMHMDEVQSFWDRYDVNKDNLLTWEEFREGINHWQWCMQDRSIIEERV